MAQAEAFCTKPEKHLAGATEFFHLLEHQPKYLLDMLV
jgi:hypothetical protein